MKANNEKLRNKKETELPSDNFPVVGIGASAGGLDAFKKLLKAVPENSGMAYILIQHMDPTHESLLPELIQKITSLPVLEVSDKMTVQPDHIYIMPRGKIMYAQDDVLLLKPLVKDKNEHVLIIDVFFTSLAETLQSNAIGVVLSGTGSDGTKGLKAIMEHGGITIAQSEETAGFSGMPQSARLSGAVDFILPPEMIPQKLLEITRITNRPAAESDKQLPQDDDLIKQVLALLRVRKGTDFNFYKLKTIRRRILRRMALNKNETPDNYLTFLRESKEEQDLLYKDLLIPVTSFFRDQRSFDHLCRVIFPQIVKNKNDNEPIRIWVAGCSTGQEAYSLAICLKEYMGVRQEKLQIFATDINESAIIKARAGVYLKTELEGLSPQRIQEFFVKTNAGYQVNSSIRDICIFAVHNFLKDPPFGKLDLISCRNVLIYMEPFLQKKALTIFHYALNKNGFLFLGNSESVSTVSELFIVNHKTDKIFSRREAPARLMLTTSPRSEQAMADVGTKSYPDNQRRPDFQKTADDIILNNYTPAGVVVNDAMDIVHFRGKTSQYLEQASGKPSHNVIKMAKEGLAFELRNILHKAKKEHIAVTKDNIQITDHGIVRNVSLEVIPLPEVIEPHYMILFHEGFKNRIADEKDENLNPGKKKQHKKDNPLPNDETDRLKSQVSGLKKELYQLREDMRSITEDQEAVNEELQSANEELLSSSEELQSLNEELETGKEELQSTNEELIVVNQELIALNTQLTEARNYAETIIATLREPLLVLNKNLRIIAGNKIFYKVFQVKEEDTEGKLIYNLGDRQWDIPELRSLLENILPNKQNLHDFEVSGDFPVIGSRTMMLNASEIIRENGMEKLILISFEDVTEERRSQQKERKLLNKYQNLVARAPMAILILKGGDYEVEFVNDYFLKWVDRKTGFIGRSLFDSMPELQSQNLKTDLDAVMKTGSSLSGGAIDFTLNTSKDDEQRFFNFAYEPLREDDGTITGIILMGTEVKEDQ